MKSVLWGVYKNLDFASQKAFHWSMLKNPVSAAQKVYFFKSADHKMSKIFYNSFLITSFRITSFS